MHKSYIIILGAFSNFENISVFKEIYIRGKEVGRGVGIGV